MTATDKDDEYCATANKAGAKIRSLYEHANRDVHEAVERVDTHIHQKPVESSLIALGIGVALGLLLGGRR